MHKFSQPLSGMIAGRKSFFEQIIFEKDGYSKEWEEEALRRGLSNKKNTIEAIECLKMQTRRYAKRQITWFRRNDEIHWVYPDEYQNVDDIYNDVFKYITMNMR